MQLDSAALFDITARVSSRNEVNYIYDVLKVAFSLGVKQTMFEIET